MMRKTKKRSSAIENFYAVRRGRQVGIFHTWEECQRSVVHFSNARFKRFDTLAEAQEFMGAEQEEEEEEERKVVHPLPSSNHPADPTSTVLSRRKRKIEVDDADDVGHAAAYTATSTHHLTTLVREMQPATHSKRAKNFALEEENARGKAGVPIPLAKVSTKTTTVTETRTSTHAIVYTDGACKGNGYRGAKAGYSTWWGDGDPRNVSEPLPGSVQTNNRAEYHGVNKAIQQAIDSGLQSVTVRTDSKLIHDTYNKGWMRAWQRKGWKKADGQPVKNLDLVMELDSLTQRIQVQIEHVRGHVGHYGNERADKLANIGVEAHHR